MSYYGDNFNPVDYENNSFSNTDEMKKAIKDIKQSDRGYNKIWRTVEKNGKFKKTGIEVYTSSCCGNHIRDAETGEFYDHIVGSADEDLYYKVILATGECNSKNGSSTLFYLSPTHFMKHLHKNLDDAFISLWNEKRAFYLANKSKKTASQ